MKTYTLNITAPAKETTIYVLWTYDDEAWVEKYVVTAHDSMPIEVIAQAVERAITVDRDSQPAGAMHRLVMEINQL